MKKDKRTSHNCFSFSNMDMFSPRKTSPKKSRPFLLVDTYYLKRNNLMKDSSPYSGDPKKRMLYAEIHSFSKDSTLIIRDGENVWIPNQYIHNKKKRT